MVAVATPVSALSLRFLDPQIEREYRTERGVRADTRQTLLSYATTIVIWIAFAIWSRYLMPADQATLQIIALGGAVPLIALGAVLNILPSTRRHAHRIEPVSYFLVGLCIVIAQALLPGRFEQYSYFFLAYYCMSVHAMMGLRFLTASGISFFLILSYFIVVVWIAPLPPLIVLNNTVWLVAAHLLGMRVSYIEERSRKRDFFRNRMLDQERQKSDRLLLNILPEPIAARLKQGGETIADALDEVTVLFADLVGFTVLSARLSPAEVVTFLNRLFSAFDEIAERHGLEKIKTIGDSYMVASGLPMPRADHARAVAEMAIEMLQAIQRMTDLGPLQMRVGIHTGPVVAGVIGKKKYSYDLWGDTVNTASRMESHGRAGAIHVSAEFYAALAAEYDFEPRGPVEIKGKGALNTYWLLGRRTPPSPEQKGGATPAHSENPEPPGKNQQTATSPPASSLEAEA